MAEIIIQAWGKTTTVTYPDHLENLGPAAFRTLADPDDIPEDMTDQEWAISEVVRFVTDTMKAARAHEDKIFLRQDADAFSEQLERITVEVG